MRNCQSYLQIQKFTYVAYIDSLKELVEHIFDVSRNQLLDMPLMLQKEAELQAKPPGGAGMTSSSAATAAYVRVDLPVKQLGPIQLVPPCLRMIFFESTGCFFVGCGLLYG